MVIDPNIDSKHYKQMLEDNQGLSFLFLESLGHKKLTISLVFFVHYLTCWSKSASLILMNGVNTQKTLSF